MGFFIFPEDNALFENKKVKKNEFIICLINIVIYYKKRTVCLFARLVCNNGSIHTAGFLSSFVISHTCLQTFLNPFIYQQITALIIFKIVLFFRDWI